MIGSKSNPWDFKMVLKRFKWLVQLLFLMGAASSQVLGEPASGPIDYDLMGQVVDAAGSGMPGVTVWAINIEGGAINATEAINTSTNATGRYGYDLLPGNYTIMAELPGYSFTASSARVWMGNATVGQLITGYAAGTESPPTALLTPIQPPVGNQSIVSQFYTGVLGRGAGWVEGRIVSQGGVPIPMASIRVDGIWTSATSDQQGYYKIALNPGLHRIDADKMGYGIPPRVVPVFVGQTSILDLFGKGTAVLGIGR
jgi:Carboxypeptidase regulatory-like domain